MLARETGQLISSVDIMVRHADPIDQSGAREYRIYYTYTELVS